MELGVRNVHASRKLTAPGNSRRSVRVITKEAAAPDTLNNITIAVEAASGYTAAELGA